MTITIALIAITVAISFYGFGRPEWQGRLMMNPYAIRHKKQFYRLLTSGFIHKDQMHLIFNMISFYFLGTMVEQVFVGLFGSAGSFYFVLMYGLAIVVSDLPTYWKQKGNQNYNSLGASGGVAAVVFAFIILEPMQYICLYFAICMPGFILGTLYLLYSYYQGRKSNDNINHDAHLYGALFGLVFCTMIYPACIGNFIRQVTLWISSF